MSQTFYSIHDYYISHHGIKGQKWGIRRYQNPDGTLTEEGKKRYGTISRYYEKKTARRALAATASMFGGWVGTALAMPVAVAAGAPAVAMAPFLAGIIGGSVLLKTGDQLQSMTAKGDRARKLADEEARALSSQILSTGVNNGRIQANEGDLKKYLYSRA